MRPSRVSPRSAACPPRGEAPIALWTWITFPVWRFWSPGKRLSITIYANIFVIVLCTDFAVLGLEFLPDWNAPAVTRFNMNLVDQSSVLEGFVAKKSVSQSVITSDLSRSDDCCRFCSAIISTGVIAPVPGIMRLFWAFSSSNPPESPSQEDSSLANMLDTLEARCRSDGPPAGPRSIDPLPGSRSFLTVSAVA